MLTVAFYFFMKIIDLPKSILELKDEGYVYVRFKDEVDFEIEDAKVQEAALVKLCNNQAYPFVVDGRVSFSNISNDARHYLAKSELLQAVRLAQALIVDSLAYSLVANIYITVNKPNNPVKIFSNKADAINWIQQFIK